ncbi:MAG: nitroreductase family protein [Candidatus Woesearchaeota archaeon]
MDIFEAITTRRSVRKYLDTPIEWEKVSKILEAARLAPSAGNVQEWKFVVVTQPELIKKMAEAAVSQRWMETAPIIIVICAKMEKITRYFGLRGERLYSIQNCAIAATHMILAARSLGLDTCWVGAFEENMVQRALGIPDDVRPQVILTLGYADEKPNPTYRLPIENMVYINGYGGSKRIKDIGKVLWDHNYVGRAVASTQTMAAAVEKKTSKQRKDIAATIKEQVSKISKKIRPKD